MKDDLERFIAENRSEMDTIEPQSELIWEGIQAPKAEKKYSKKLRVWQVAAALLALFSLGHLGFDLLQRGASSNSVVNERMPSALEVLEASYQSEVADLTDKVKSKHINATEFTALYQELDYFDNIQKEFTDEISLTNDKERIAEILVDTYEKKIKLLERMLLQIEREEKVGKLNEQEFKNL